MAKEKMKEAKEDKCCKMPFHGHGHCGCHGAGYGLGFIAAAVYFIGQASTFWGVVLGFLKAIVWPVFLVHALLKFLGA